MHVRRLSRADISLIWTIDRSEVIEGIYALEEGELVLRPEHFEAAGWPPGEADLYGPILLDCYDRGGWFCGLFEGNRLIGVAVLESKFIGRDRDQLQLKFLHVGNGYRGQGLGTKLFDLARDEARRRDARQLYISATPSQNTIDFYLRRGCHVTPEPDPALFALEPEDIHLECDV
ncbi:MAG: GNAT family N-acetyltransferase [Caldilineales bacterium]